MKIYLAIICFTMLFYTIPSKAVLLVAGDSVSLPGTTVEAEPQLAGTVVNDNLISDVLEFGESYLAVGLSIQNRVVVSELTGNLIFAPRILVDFNISSDSFLIDSASITGYGDFTTNVNYRTDGAGVRGPNNADRSVDGNVLGFDFLFPLFVGNLFSLPQEDSHFFSIETNATEYSLDGVMTVTGRHLDFDGETFTFIFNDVAVPVLPRRVNSPAPLSLLLFASLILVFRKHLRTS